MVKSSGKSGFIDIFYLTLFLTIPVLWIVLFSIAAANFPLWFLLIPQAGLSIYFLLIRPQQKKAKKHQELVNSLKRDDMVVTTGGIHGKITGVTDTIITIEIAPNVRIKVSKGHVSGLSEGIKKQAD